MDNSEKYQPELSRMYRLQRTQDLCRTMLDEGKCKELLNEYEDSNLMKATYKLHDKVKKQQVYYQTFNLSQMINMKGNKKHQNPDLKRFLIFKLYSNQQITIDSRRQLWMQFTDLKDHKTMYDTIKNLTTSQRYFDQTINKDLNRTVGTPENIKMTYNILSTIAKYNPFVGYCQGFNNIVMFLVQEGFTQEQSFFIWKYISLEILPTDYYTSMISVLTDVDIILTLFSLLNSKCSQSVQANKQKLTSLILPWLICLFTREPLQEQLTRIFWDFLIVEGLTALYKAALALLSYVSDIIENSSDQQMIRKSEQKLKTLTTAPECNLIKQKMQSIYINPNILTLCRSCICSEYQKKQNEVNYRRKPAAKQCNTNSHICIQQLQNNRYQLQNRSYQCQSFRIKKPINILLDYLDTIQSKDFCTAKKKQEKQEDLLMIGRIDHVCKAFKNEEQTHLEENHPRSDSRLFGNRGMERTESMAFFEVLMENPSFSNMFQNEEIWDNRVTPYVYVSEQSIRMTRKINTE